MQMPNGKAPQLAEQVQYLYQMTTEERNDHKNFLQKQYEEIQEQLRLVDQELLELQKYADSSQQISVQQHQQQYSKFDPSRSPSSKRAMDGARPSEPKKARVDSGHSKQQIIKELFDICRKILEEMKKHKSGHLFAQPVHPEKDHAPNYLKIIKQPMDYGSIGKQLEVRDGQRKYKNVSEFGHHMRLIYANARQFNPHYHNVHKEAIKAAEKFEKIWKEKQVEHRWKVEVEGQEPEPQEQLEQPETLQKNDSKRLDVNTIPQIKAMSLDLQKSVQQLATPAIISNPASWQERRKLSHDLGQLPGKHLQRALDIICRTMQLDYSQSEIELDIDTLDQATVTQLRNLCNEELRPKKSANANKPVPDSKSSRPSSQLDGNQDYPPSMKHNHIHDVGLGAGDQIPNGYQGNRGVDSKTFKQSTISNQANGGDSKCDITQSNGQAGQAQRQAGAYGTQRTDKDKRSALEDGTSGNNKVQAKGSPVPSGTTQFSGTTLTDSAFKTSGATDNGAKKPADNDVNGVIKHMDVDVEVLKNPSGRNALASTGGKQSQLAGQQGHESKHQSKNMWSQLAQQRGHTINGGDNQHPGARDDDWAKQQREDEERERKLQETHQKREKLLEQHQQKKEAEQRAKQQQENEEARKEKEERERVIQDRRESTLQEVDDFMIFGPSQTHFNAPSMTPNASVLQ